MLQLVIAQDFLTNLLSNLINNLAEGNHKDKCKYGHIDKKCKACNI